jgi:hypothetical protein
MKLSGNKLVGSSPKNKRVENDFYATNPETVKKFFKEFAKKNTIGLDDVFWECACGNGNISKVIELFYPENKIISTDLINRGYGNVEDFLQSERKADVIITNPPFALLNDFIKHGLEQTNRFLIFFAKIQLLETKARVEILKNSPLRYVYVHSERQATWRNGAQFDENGKPWAQTMCMAWFIWDKEYKGEPILRFI